jgi:Carboxypeptidase regulatory-like domain
MRFRRAELSAFLSPFVCVLAAALTTFSSAQQPAVQTTGQIAGTVTDADGAVVAEANIALENRLNHQQYTSKSDDTGFFNFTALSPGVFHITISAKGFADWTATDVILKPGQDYDLVDITLKIPSVNVSVQALTQHEIAGEQVKVEETQRILGIVPNYYAVYDWNAAPMSPRLKFSLAWKTELDPFSVFASGAIAGVQQWQNDFPEYGQGAQGYGKRFGASYADTFSDIMLSGAILPVLLHQDPRYFYKGTGTVFSRTLYALATTVICRGDNGRWQPNYSNVFGTLASGAVSNLYYPPSSRGVRLTINNSFINIAGGAIGGLAQEFFLKRMTPNANKSP